MSSSKKWAWKTLKIKVLLIACYSMAAMAYEPSLMPEEVDKMLVRPTQNIPFYRALIGLKIKRSDFVETTCSGVAILPNLILTAAHCLVNENDHRDTYGMSKVRIYLPYYDPTHKKGKKYTFNDADATIMIPPEYSASSRNEKMNDKDDLALIHITNKNQYIEKKNTILGINDQYNDPYIIIPGVYATFSKYYSSYQRATNYALPPGSKESDFFKVTDKVYALGWGSKYDTEKTRYSSINTDIYDAVSMACAEIKANIYMHNSYQTEYIIGLGLGLRNTVMSDDVFCRYQYTLLGEPGDSGGPLFLVKPNSHLVYLIGVLSRSTNPEGPAVSTFAALISNNQSWLYIKAIIGSALSELTE